MVRARARARDDDPRRAVAPRARVRRARGFLPSRHTQLGEREAGRGVVRGGGIFARGAHSVVGMFQIKIAPSEPTETIDFWSGLILTPLMVPEWPEPTACAMPSS